MDNTMTPETEPESTTEIDFTKYVAIGRRDGSHQQIAIHRHGPNGTHTVSLQSYIGCYVGFDLQLSREEFAAIHAAMGEALEAGQ